MSQQNPSTEPLANWLDKQDVLQKLHISERTLQSWRSKHRIAYCKIGKKIFYDLQDVNNFINRYKTNHY